jgi:two-component system, sensor histidine kinase
VVANLVAVGLLLWYSRAMPALTPVTLWGGAMVVASAAAWLMSQRVDPEKATRRTVDAIAAWAVMFGVLWALVPIVCLLGQRSNLCLLTVGVAMAVGGLGACGLARVPAAALLFTGILTTAIAATSQVLDTRIAIAAVRLHRNIRGGAAVMIIGAHRTALSRAADAAELERQGEIIQLLLKDFEAGASDWLWETGPDGELVYVSDRLAQVLRREPDWIIGAKLHQAAGMSQTASGWRALAVLMARREAGARPRGAGAAQGHDRLVAAQRAAAHRRLRRLPRLSRRRQRHHRPARGGVRSCVPRSRRSGRARPSRVSLLP